MNPFQDQRIQMDILGIKEYPFSEPILKTAYRKKAFEFHPDVSGTETEEKMKKINTAYTLLLPYTQKLGCVETEKWEIPETDIFKLWETCKACSGKGYNLRQVPSVEACPDCPSKHRSVGGWMAFIFAFSGFSDSIRSQGYHKGQCPSCLGKGQNSRMKECSRCDGTGEVKIVCATCNGKGVKRNKEQYIKEKCWDCSSRGKIEIKPFDPVIRKGAVLNGKGGKDK
uniref:Putative chaperone n=1 Tax=viral metagenome TaxID=1070528 RepID=A0A6M3X7J8_9ZZZZ